MSIVKPIFKISFGFLFLLISSFGLKAQNYNTAIGLRGGTGLGISAKHFIQNDIALEGILNTRYSGFNFTGLYEWHKPAFNTEGFNWFYGLGAHIGFWDGDKIPWINDNEAYTIIGVDAIGGLEYKIQNLPIAISLDWKPAINLIGYTGFWGDNAAFSIRYCF
tara:strand:+ start:176 stop:664 length:489 start_codon:yes stop_codon:yes gene_type:complete